MKLEAFSHLIIISLFIGCDNTGETEVGQTQDTQNPNQYGIDKIEFTLIKKLI